ncbi:MAG: hypothetical protein H0T42_17730 [Deltaproteobacteria bacterium]|nr:hypothetical protein [Deltaproteobacteria bacterium]
MQIDPEAYNALGAHLSNDEKQSRRILVATFFAAIVSILFLLWMVYE